MSARPRLYDGKGPWPQPNPQRPNGEAAIVLHGPKDQQKDWQKHIGARYKRQLLFGIPRAILEAIENKIDAYPSDADFSTMMTTGIYSKFLTPLDGGADEAPFAALVANPPPGSRFWKIDLSAIKGVKPYPGMYVAATLSLVLEKATGERSVIAILVGDDLLLEPVNRNAFDLAKLFVMQAASYGILFTEHPNLHFPFDAINAITQTILPTDHVVFRLLWPHLRFQLMLNLSVLESQSSVITNRQETFYAPFTANLSDGMLDFFVAGYEGVPGRSGYPPYDFWKRPKKIPSDYGVFLERYYDTVLRFTTKVVAKLPVADRDMMPDWARHCANYVPGFPDETRILEPGVLEETLARILWDLSIAHGADHEVFGNRVTPEQKLLRIRVPPPAAKEIDPVDPASVTWFRDRFKMRLAHRVFFVPTLVTSLLDADYRFTDPALVALQQEFKQELRETDAQMPVERFMKLEDMPASIQY